ncbi:hypothetical protein FDH02_gp35 [Pseudomonas phage VSW-3]|uniref:Uncharacterized protein n=1 Tax=Pseudomonas phage VSW-3 TaxID=1852562 RepID=A0A173GCN4_9CAUD|nr:hypothetical protein FDH02_gp35 [Pseudomonas phage VSW-3]ANH51111.1 hypothetical protein VSW3_35 [Pseudomonas phage VSW-3]
MTTKANAMPTLIVGTEALRKEFTSIAAAGKKLDGRIQVAGLSVMSHIDTHGDVTVATALVNELFGALSKGHRKAAMVEWLVKYGKVKLNTDEATKKAQPFLFDKSAKTNLQGACDEPWFDCKPEKLDEDFDFNKLLLALLSKAAKKNATDPTKVIGADMLAKVQALVEAEPAAPVAAK